MKSLVIMQVGVARPMWPLNVITVRHEIGHAPTAAVRNHGIVEHGGCKMARPIVVDMCKYVMARLRPDQPNTHAMVLSMNGMTCDPVRV